MSELEFWRCVLRDYRNERKKRATGLSLAIIDRAIEVAKSNIEYLLLKGEDKCT